MSQELGDIEEQVICGDCGSHMILRKDKFGHWFYSCSRFPECQGTHGVHQKTGLPMGTPADKKTRYWRMRAHQALDKYWRDWGLKRWEVYQMLSMAMDLPKEETHIGMFTIDQCKKVVEICNEGLKVIR